MELIKNKDYQLVIRFLKEFSLLTYWRTYVKKHLGFYKINFTHVDTILGSTDFTSFVIKRNKGINDMVNGIMISDLFRIYLYVLYTDDVICGKINFKYVFATSYKTACTKLSNQVLDVFNRLGYSHDEIKRRTKKVVSEFYC